MSFREHTPLAEARERLAARVEPIDRTEPAAIGRADGRVLAEPVDAARDVPHFRRAAMDGYAIRSEDAAGASARSPILGRVGPNCYARDGRRWGA